MTILVTDEGFAEATPVDLTLAPDCDPESVDIKTKAIAISFTSFADGRGFGIARALRRRGYQGHLRAVGHVIADQYAMARRVGFDAVEISKELAERQDESQWMARANWREHDYQTRLGQIR